MNFKFLNGVLAVGWKKKGVVLTRGKRKMGIKVGKQAGSVIDRILAGVNTVTGMLGHSDHLARCQESLGDTHDESAVAE